MEMNSSLDDTASGAERIIDACDLDTFCENCLKVLSVTKAGSTGVKHMPLLDVVHSSERCKFCRFIFTSFGRDVVEKMRLRTHTENLPSVVVRTRKSSGENEMLTEGIDMRIFLDNDSTGGREYVAMGVRARSIRRAIWSQADPIDFPARKPTIVEWLEECRSSHPKCQSTLSPDSALAARILSVRYEHGQLRIRLVSTQALDLHRVSYVVLSHCWGGVDIESETTRHNVAQYHDNIEIETLPKTFREAIEIAYAIGIPYIWIDSLCIIQKDNEDFKREAAKMASIFQGSTFTISATSAQNSLQGCGISNILEPAIQFTTKPDRLSNKPNLIAFRETTLWKSEYSMRDVLRDSPVHTRAWILQEKVLSRRILHATHSLFIWQCATHIETEDGLVYHKDKNGNGPWEVLGSHVPEHVIRPVQPRFNIRTRWWSWVDEYMQRNLSHLSDHYAALAGVTNLYRHLTGDEPVFGLWKKDLHIHLAWFAWKKDNVNWEALERPRNPSWTWLTYPHGSVRPMLHEKFDSFDGVEGSDALPMWYEAQVLDIDIQWTGEPLVSEPEHGILTLHGLFDRRVMPEDRSIRYDGGDKVLDPETVAGGDLGREFDVFALFAYEEQAIMIVNPPRLMVISLVLEATGVREAEFRRVGRMERWIDLPPGTTAQGSLPGTFRTITLV